jgi:hypothetical protein
VKGPVPASSPLRPVVAVPLSPPSFTPITRHITVVLNRPRCLPDPFGVASVRMHVIRPQLQEKHVCQPSFPVRSMNQPLSLFALDRP